jgi:hypothetical protein
LALRHVCGLHLVTGYGGIKHAHIMTAFQSINVTPVAMKLKKLMPAIH